MRSSGCVGRNSFAMSASQFACTGTALCMLLARQATHKITAANTHSHRLLCCSSLICADKTGAQSTRTSAHISVSIRNTAV